jgi:ABC-2 type transport system permease protein
MKILKIAWKDFKITYRDIGALLLMIGAPIVMTLIMAFAFSGTSDSGFSPIPVALINLDDGKLGQMFHDVLTSEDLQEYLQIEKYDSLETAQKHLDQDKIGAIIVIPSNASALTDFDAQGTATSWEDLSVHIDLYTNPVRQISGMIVEAIMDTILTQFNAAFIGVQLGVSELIQQDAIETEELTEEWGGELEEKLKPMIEENEAQIEIETRYWQENAEQFNWLSYMAPSMAILYLGFSMTASARSILSEKEYGTFGRLLASPTNSMAIVVGKMLGTFLIGLIQVFIFILISIPILDLSWGPAPTLILFTVVLVLASASWGIVIASLAKNSGQAMALGMAVNLAFAAVAGNFVPRTNYPDWLQKIGYLTPNAWGIEGYLKLINGGGFADVQSAILALLAMAVILLMVASFGFALQFGQLKKVKVNHE